MEACSRLGALSMEFRVCSFFGFLYRPAVVKKGGG